MMWPFKRKKKFISFTEAIIGVSPEQMHEYDPEWWDEYHIAPVGTALKAFSERNPGAIPRLDAWIARDN